MSEFRVVVELSALGLDRINRIYEPVDHFASLEEYQTRLLERAQAVSSFAVNVGLIRPGDARAIFDEMKRDYPELFGLPIEHG
ncbi:MAG: hypothetical protein ACKVVP_08475 [Chloroflexota bacterium]